MGKITEIFPNNLKEKEIGYLIGLFIGDGYSYIHNRHYVVEFYFNSINDKEIINYIKYLLESLGLNLFQRKDKRFNCLRIRTNSKNFLFFINKEIIKLDQTKNKNYLIGFISGVIDSEGYVNNGEIQLCQKDKNILLMIKKFCKFLDIPTRKFWFIKNYKSKNKLWKLRIATDFKNLEHNSKKIKRAYNL